MYLCIAVPAWRGREQLPPKSQKFGQNRNFSGSNKKNSDKIRNFKAVARNYLSKTKFFSKKSFIGMINMFSG